MSDIVTSSFKFLFYDTLRNIGLLFETSLSKENSMKINAN